MAVRDPDTAVSRRDPAVSRRDPAVRGQDTATSRRDPATRRRGPTGPRRNRPHAALDHSWRDDPRSRMGFDEQTGLGLSPAERAIQIA